MPSPWCVSCTTTCSSRARAVERCPARFRCPFDLNWCGRSRVLAEYGHFGRAAEAVHRRQPSPSRQIRQLEPPWTWASPVARRDGPGAVGAGSGGRVSPSPSGGLRPWPSAPSATPQDLLRGT
ncbi:LysR family transcriptional regulator [Streptomyces sp. NPDC056638]|uniref:LysR family transcriptional regulator n=1 Tax=Streptomyces sp. NPDC056638 TaxID=3345887 RepID=UPI00367FEA51